MENSFDQREQELLKQLEEVRRQREEALKPLQIFVSNFDPALGTFQVKTSKYDSRYVEIVRFTPTRYHRYSDHVDIVNSEQFEPLINKLKEIGEINLEDGIFDKIHDYNNRPDFHFSLDEKRSEIKVIVGPRQKFRIYYNDIETLTYHPNGNFYTIHFSDAYKIPAFVDEYLRNRKVLIDEDVSNLIKDQIADRDKILNLHSLTDAPDIPDIFYDKYHVDFHLTKDQKVALKFDDALKHRAIIAYGMGKGKTAIAIANAEMYDERILFVTKASLKTNVVREIKRLTGKEAIVFSGIDPDAIAIDYMLTNKQQYNVINYDILGRGVKDKNTDEVMMKWVHLINFSKFDRIIYDEAHMMRNMESLRSRAGRSTESTKVTLMTGTALVNRPMDLYPILAIVDPKKFNNFAAFKQTYTNSDGSPRNIQQLRELIKMYMIVRENDDSQIIRTPQYIEMDSFARGIYNKALNGLYIALRNPNYQKDITNVLTELLRLKQITSSAKVEATAELAIEAIEETNKKVLIFSQFLDTQAELSKKIPNSVVINGSVKDKDRYDLIDKFQDPNSDLKVIISNIEEGLTLTEAHTVIFNDHTWTFKTIQQFEGRAFGRENDLHFGNSYHMVATSTIDENIWNIIWNKYGMKKAIIDGENDIDNNSIVNVLIKDLKDNM